VVGFRAAWKIATANDGPGAASNPAETAAMLSRIILVLATLFAAGNVGSAAEYEIANQSDIVYAVHDGVKLVGDLYLPKGKSRAPVLVAIHGGAWQSGNKQYYRYWGLFLARAGYAVFAVDYRLGKAGMYPSAVYDAKAAVQFIRAKAGELDLDPDRIGFLGDSAGGHLGALIALAGDRFTSAYRDDATANVPASVKCVVAFYGIYDMYAQWVHDQTAFPDNNIVEKFLGGSPRQNRQVYVDASPISYAAVDHNQVRFLLIHGTEDNFVDAATQSSAFLTALAQAGIFAQRIAIPGAGHFWVQEQFENKPRSYAARTIPQMMRFLESSL
jgi:acetyl esterase/lipase